MSLRFFQSIKFLTVFLCLQSSVVLACIGTGVGDAATTACKNYWNQSTASSSCEERSISASGVDSETGEKMCYIEAKCEYESTDAAGNTSTYSNSDAGTFKCDDVSNLKNCDGELEVGQCS